LGAKASARRAALPAAGGGAIAGVGSPSGTICPQPGANCQTADVSFGLTSDGTLFSVADDFRLAVSGSVSQVCFRGAYFDFTVNLDCGAQGGNDFIINYYADAGGKPGTQIASFRQSLGTLTVGGPIATGQRLAGTADEFEFVASHDPVPLSAGACYWIEIVDRLPGSCSWVWEGALPGNEWVLQDDEADGFDFADSLPDDMSFCFDQPLMDPAPCRPPPPPNDDCLDAEVISGTGEFPFDVTTATADGPSHSACLKNGESRIDADVWYCWTSPCTDRIVLSTCQLTNVDTRIAVYEGCGTCPPSDLALLTCNDDRCGDTLPPLQSFAVFDAVEGQSYAIRIGTFPDAIRGTGRFSLSCGPPAQSTCGPAAGAEDCCAPTDPFGLGCTDASCCNLVCACDPFCCTTGWDTGCATTGFLNSGCGAELLCEDLCGPCGTSTVDCCVGVASGAGMGGCNDPLCCEAVCAKDSFCCEVEWDNACATTGFNNNGNGAAVICPALCGSTHCASGTFTFVDPPSGSVDARQPHPPGSPEMLQGITQIGLTGPVLQSSVPTCWSVCETDTGGQAANEVVDVSTDGAGNFVLTLARPITPGAVTTVTYTNDDGFTTTGVFVSHPGDVDGDGVSGAGDVLDLLNVLSAGRVPRGLVPDLLRWDIDRSGAVGPADVLRLIDLLTGADGYAVWSGTQQPACGTCCP
ncbi:MAG: hypothetical protein D6788_07825, partial [Planctomycetota bacterium]